MIAGMGDKGEDLLYKSVGAIEGCHGNIRRPDPPPTWAACMECRDSGHINKTESLSIFEIEQTYSVTGNGYPDLYSP